MIINGINLPNIFKYVKFTISDTPNVQAHFDLKAVDYYGKTSNDFIALGSDVLYDIPIDTDLEYIKLPEPPQLELPNITLKKLIYEDLILSILIIKLDSDDVIQNAQSVVYWSYGRVIVLLREDEATISKLIELLSQVNQLEIISQAEGKSPVGNLFNFPIRKKNLSAQYEDMNSLSWHETVAELDWSQGFEKLLNIINDQLSIYGFNYPLAVTAQELPDKGNLAKYKFGEIQPDDRGHLVGNRWKYFFMNKLPFELEFVLSDSSQYMKLLYEMNSMLRITNIANYQVQSYQGNPWDVAILWNYPIENTLDVSDQHGESDTTGNVIRLTGTMYYNTLNRAQIQYNINEILMEITDGDIVFESYTKSK